MIRIKKSNVGVKITIFPLNGFFAFNFFQKTFNADLTLNF
jgi:hypothetical protein